MPNDYFVPGYDSLDQFGRRKFMPPPVRPLQAPQLRPMPAMIGQPPLQGGMEENAVPQEMQVERMGPPPLKPLSRLDRFDEMQQGRPEPAGVGLRAIKGLQRGGVIGALGAVLDRDAPKREQFEADRKAFMDRAGLEHQETQDELAGLQKRAYAENINSQIADRVDRQKNADAALEQRAVPQGAVPVAPGELQEMPEDGKPSRYEYITAANGKTYKRRTPYADAADKKAAEQETYREVPPKIAEALGFAPGTKVPPNELDGYAKAYQSQLAADAKTPEAQVAARTRIADQQGLKGRDRQVYIATGNIERPVNVSVTGGAGGDTASTIAKEIAEGRQPPDTKGLYRYGAAVRAELGKMGYDLTGAQRDWQAVSRHVATMNGPQQERLRQAVQTTYDGLDNIEELYGRWKQIGGNYGIKVFNRASLAAAKNLSGEAGEIATRLEAQINDLTSEMATVYKGGNSSTDEGLKLAAANLKAEWNERTFAGALKDLRRNLQIRRNSIINSHPAGVSADSPYVPKAAADAPGTPKPTHRFNPQTGRIEEIK